MLLILKHIDAYSRILMTDLGLTAMVFIAENSCRRHARSACVGMCACRRHLSGVSMCCVCRLCAAIQWRYTGVTGS